MRRRQREQIEPTVATHFPSLSRGRDINQNVHMFTEDVHLVVMPIGGRVERHKDFTVTLKASPGERGKAEYLIREIGRYDRHDIVGMVCDAVEEVARNLSWEGCAVYEIIRSDDGVQHLCGFTSKRLWRVPGHFLQIIPRGDWDLWKKKSVIVPAGRIWYLEMPPALGGGRGYKRVLRRLKAFEHLGPHFWRKDLERGVQSRNFDFQRYARNSEIYYGQVTKTWGWNRRDRSQERCTEFVTFYKLLRFSWAQAMLREHIVGEMNELFARLGIECELNVAGLPTADDILQTRSELLVGRISFGAASDRVRF